jgi:phosphate transport system protein
VIRLNFAEELEHAERGLLSEGALVGKQLDRVMRALGERDLDLARLVVDEDDAVDGIYLATDARVLNLIALQAPVAGDLRLVSAILHSNVHLERMGDLCVNIAKSVLNDHPYPSESPMLERLQEMGDRAQDMLQLSLAAMRDRSAEVAEELPDKDDALDRLNRGMLGELKRYADDESNFEWAVHLILIARYLERFGDHAVDIGEQVAFLATGVFREFEDASHPSEDTQIR